MEFASLKVMVLFAYLSLGYTPFVLQCVLHPFISGLSELAILNRYRVYLVSPWVLHYSAFILQAAGD